MSKDSDNQGLSRILKLSLNAAFGTTASSHAVSVQAHGECEAPVDQGSSCTTDHVNTTSRLEVDGVSVVIEEDLNNTDRHACASKFTKRAVYKFGRGRGRKLAEKCSKPGFLLQNDECAASNICENQPDDVHPQITSDASLGIAKMANGSGAGKNITEKQCVDIGSLTNNDKPRLTKEEDTCELPDLVKCQTSTEHINSTPKNKELNTGVGNQDHSNSSTLDCSAFSDKTKTTEHLLLSKSLSPERNIYSRGKYPHGIQKQNREAVAPWKGKATPDSGDFFRGKRTGQQFRAYGRNSYTKKELFCSVPSEKRRLNKSLNCLKQPSFQNHGVTCRDDYQRWRNKFTNKQTQDIRFCVSNKDTSKTQPHELKEERGRGTKEQEGNISKVKHMMEDTRRTKQEVNDSKTNQQKAGGSTSKHETDYRKSKQHNANDREINHQKAEHSKANHQKAEHSKANHQKADGSKVSQQKADDRANQQKADDGRSNQEINESKSKQSETKASRSKHEVYDRNPKQQGANNNKAKYDADTIKSKQQQYDIKHEQQVRPNEADQQGDDSKTSQREGDDSKVNKQKGDKIKSNKQEADSKSKPQKVHKGNDIRNYFTVKPSIKLVSEMKHVDNLDSVSREQQNYQPVQEASKTHTAEAAANRLYQDASGMTERHRHISLHNKEHISFQNIVNVSTENTDNSVVVKTSIAAGTVSMQEPFQAASSGFVGCNSSVHTMINAIYQSYEEATVQCDGKPAELLSSNVEMQGSTDGDYVPGEESAHAQEESTLKCIASAAEKDLAVLDDEFSAEEKREGYTSASVQKGGDNECVDVKNREVMKSASQEEIGDIVCKEERDNELSISEQKEAIVCEVSTYTDKEKQEDNNYISEEKGELHVCTSQEKRDVISALEQNGEVVISVSDQKEEVKISASKVRGDILRNYKDMLVNNMNYETLKINQDLENDLHPASSIVPQEISLPSCHMSDSPSKLYAYLPTTVGSEHSRLCETVLSQNPLEESSDDHCTPREPKVLPSQQIMVGQPEHSHSNVPDTSHPHTPYYECSTRPDSYLCSASSLNTSEGKQKNSSFPPYFHTREFNLPAEALGSEAAMDRIMTFLRSCSTSIHQHMSHYNDNHPLDVTITVSLTHPPSPDYIPRFLHHPGNPYLEDRSRPPYPLPVYPYPGWVPAYPPYWSWQPWVERYPPSLSAPINSAPPYYSYSPSTFQSVASIDSSPLPADASNLFPSESDESSHGLAFNRPHDDSLYPRMYSCWNPAMFDGQQESERTHTLTVDHWRGCSTPEMYADNLHLDATVVEDYSMSRPQTFNNAVEEETWNDGFSTASSRHLTETVSPLYLHENHYLSGNLGTENVILSSRSSEEPVMQEAVGHSHFRQNSVRSDSFRKPLIINWTSKMTPPVANNFRNENVGASPRPPASAAGPVFNRASNLTCRPHRFQSALHFKSQAARRKSAPYHMTKPWIDHQPQNRRRKSFPVGATITSANRGNTGENGQLESEAGSSPPSNVAANRKCLGDWAAAFVSRSRSYNHRFIDCHCHIDFLYSTLGVPRETYFSKFQEQHAETFPGNYEGCVAVFCHPSTFSADNPEDDILKTVSAEDGVWLAVGCHPKHAIEFTDSHLRGLRHMLKHPKVVALGEIGLDYSGTFHQHSDVQKLVFRQQLQLALEMKLPLVIHCRDADDDCLEILTEMVPSDHRIHAHCFTRDINVAMRWMIPFQNLFLGLTPVVTYKTALDTASTATFIPLDRLLLETDAPFFVPGGVRKQDVGCSHPGFALFTAEKVAELKRISVDEVLKACRENTKKMYGI